MPTLEYEPVAPMRAPISWWLAPIIVFVAFGLSLVSILMSMHGGPLAPLMAVTGPISLMLMLVRNMSDGLFFRLLFLAVTAQYTLYFAAIRTRQPHLIRLTLGVHFGCAMLGYAIAKWLG